MLVQKSYLNEYTCLPIHGNTIDIWSVESYRVTLCIMSESFTETAKKCYFSHIMKHDVLAV